MNKLAKYIGFFAVLAVFANMASAVLFVDSQGHVLTATNGVVLNYQSGSGWVPPQSASLIAWYRFTTNETVTLVDSSGMNNWATNFGTTWATNSRAFTSGNSISMTNASTGDNPSNMTISLWVNFGSTIEQSFAGKIQTIHGSVGGWELLHLTGKEYFLFQQSSSQYVEREEGLNLADGNWHHILATKAGWTNCFIYTDGTNNTGPLYVSGSVATMANGYWFVCGMESDGIHGKFVGKLANIMWWTNILSYTEITNVTANTYPN